MHIGQRYTVPEMLYYTRREIFKLTLLAAVPTALYQLLDLHWLAVPWVPIALIGTAAAFIIGFKNTQTYSRLWEARQIWGGIVNSSRTWGVQVRHFVQADEAVHRQLIYRHLAWLTALRFQLRKPQPWENSNKIHNVEYRRRFRVPEWEGKLEDELTPLLDPQEQAYVLTKKNRATQLVSLQSAQLAALKKERRITDFDYVEMERRLADLYDQQGRCERIKNFPYPRQFASITLYFTHLFVLVLPLGMLNEFQKMGEHFAWLAIPFSVLVSWVFISMDKISEASENPFEGSANDIPMAALSRTIEIDLRDMLDEKDLPQPLTAVNNILL